MNEHSQLSHLAHSGWFDTVSLMRLLVTSMMWALSWWTWKRKRGFCYSTQCLRTCDIQRRNRNGYHSGEQQSHEEGPWDQEEDDEDADDFIQRSLQPHDHLCTKKRGGGVGGQSKYKVSLILKRLETYSDQTHGETCNLPMWRSHFGSWALCTHPLTRTNMHGNKKAAWLFFSECLTLNLLQACSSICL